MSLSATRGLKMGGAPVRIKCEVEISAILNESTEVQTLGVIRIQLYIVSIF